jgi:hypothetical protein
VQVKVRLIEDDGLPAVAAEQVHKKLDPNLQSIASPEQLAVASTPDLATKEIERRSI